MNSLPHLQTVRRWYTNVSGLPEISKDALATVQIKVNEAAENMKHLYFALIVDDMSIRQQIEIDGDRRNAYATMKDFRDENNNIIKWKYALDLVKIQEIKGLHAGTKLRRRHIQYVNEKMNKLQIVSIPVLSEYVEDTKLTVQVLYTISNNIFGNVLHMFDQAPLADHRTQLIKLITRLYLLTRLHHICRGKNDAVKRIRNKHTKIVIFKNQ
ncbi:hypothetical protein ALC60_11854 [Trachymyrmex zeteki]|uniref:Transposable element P transposase-like GTP-binding insertion domain-containing protein n=1 Tax=Mycetomoellerius zeteki TaxID=64791 RepID=A0A151WMI8_9HYME|nr:hypothetical protein ALC60_11854 [Trachymyrmex zeteki]